MWGKEQEGWRGERWGGERRAAFLFIHRVTGNANVSFYFFQADPKRVSSV